MSEIPYTCIDNCVYISYASASVQYILVIIQVQGRAEDMIFNNCTHYG